MSLLVSEAVRLRLVSRMREEDQAGGRMTDEQYKWERDARANNAEAAVVFERARADAAEAQRDRLQREVDQLSDGFWREHRPATSDEHGIDGRIHGYCRRCIKPWPCPYSPEARDALTAQRDRLAAALRKVRRLEHDQEFTPKERVRRMAEIARAALADVPKREDA